MSFQETDSKYNDMIDLPHPISKSHPQMSMHDRAAQFSPFAALTGYDDAVNEEARLTEAAIELTEGAIHQIDEKLRILQNSTESHKKVEILYFEPDQKKDGGAYQSMTGTVKKIDHYEHYLIMQDGRKILLNQIIELNIMEEEHE